MLTAITSRKAGRVQFPESEVSVSWRDIFRRSEDLLTATFFSRLRYLSDESLARVLGQLIGSETAENLGAFKEIEFWPKLTGLDERSWVEPDVLILFEGATLIVEVKPPFGGKQYFAQWQAEVHAFAVECQGNKRPPPETVHFLALGGNTCLPGAQPTSEFDVQDCFKLHVHAREWKAVVDALPTMADDCSRADRAVFNDWREAFAIFGLHARVQHTWGELRLLVEKMHLSVEALKTWVTKRIPPPAQPVLADTQKVDLTWQELLTFARKHPVRTFLWK